MFIATIILDDQLEETPLPAITRENYIEEMQKVQLYTEKVTKVLEQHNDVQT